MVSARVLLVDAGPDVEGTVSALEAIDCRVTVTDSVSEALVALRERRIDAIVTEYQLPDGNGIELLREIRSTSEQPPVIVYTAHGSEQVASEAIEAGASSYIPKGGERSVERLGEAIDRLAVTGRVGAGDEDVPTPTAESIVRAVDEAPVGITLSDPSLPDNPLVYVNDAFEEVTGYEADEVLGHNCRFLQGPDTSEEPVRKMRESIEDAEPVTVELLNYREDGTPFWNHVTIAPLFDENGDVKHFVGFQNDVTERKEAEGIAKQRADSLREERQALERVLGRVSGLVNDISHVLVNASSREEIEQQVCAEITATEGYCHAWIGEPGPAGPGMTIRVAEGDSQQAIETDGTTDWTNGVFEAAIERGTVETFSTADDLPAAIAPDAFGASTMAVVPLTYRRTTYGVLAVYAERSGVLDRRECTVFEAIGQMIASGVNAVETKRVLTADRVMELGFEITDDAFPLIELARATGSAISYNGSTVEDEGSIRVFVTLSEDREEFEAILAECSTITDGFVVARQNGTIAASIDLGESYPVQELAEYGATLRDLSVSADTGTAHLHVELPVEGDVRSVVSVLEASYDGVELVRQREREREPRPTAEFVATVAERLTDRQYTALETAYLSDYFEFPRPVSGDELAGSMGISRQTYHQHLRAAQRKLLEEFFESGS